MHFKNPSSLHIKIYPHDHTWFSGSALDWCAGGYGFNSWLDHTEELKNGKSYDMNDITLK